MNYSDLRHFADSWGLLAMAVLFAVLVGWTLRRGAGDHHDVAAHMIFKDDDHG
jgi:cytochrome c oxidase cbb3-type subunit IV